MSAEADTSQTGKLDEDKLIAILRQEERDAANWQDAELSGVRMRALDYYDRKPLGDEEDGQSKVVTSEFADTVESIMPGMMDVFTSGDAIVEFTPLSQGDEQAAREASQYVPHVLMRENDGFRIIYWFLKDALMYRLSTTIVDEEEKEQVKTDPIQGWTAEQLAAAEEIAREQGASEVTFEVAADPAPTAQDVDPATGEPIPLQETFSGSITVKSTKKRVIVDKVAPEDVLFTPNVRDIDQASFAGYRKQVSSSDLRKLGMSQEEINELASERPRSMEEDQRQDGLDSTTKGRKDSERRLWLVVAYVRADVDGDGISESLRVIYAHAGGAATSIIETMPWDGPEVPVVLGTPILMSHTVVGRSLFDQVEDLQDVGTALTRGVLDNVYMTNRPRPAINGRVNINSVIDWVPAMPIQVQGNENPANCISWLQVPSIVGPALSGLEYLATVRENRTGVTRYNQGLDADSLNKTLGGIDRIMTASQQRQKLIARVFAETALQRLMRLIYRAIKRTATGKIAYYTGEDWAECDPTTWPDDMHLVMAVGSGAGNEQQKIQNLMLIGSAQEKLIAAQGGPDGPLVKPEHVANTARKLVEAAGYRATSQFIASPKDVQTAEATPKQPTPSPEMIKVQNDATAQAAKQQSDAALQQQKLQGDMAAKREQLMAEIALKREAAEADMQLAREKAALDMQLAREKAALDGELKRQQIQAEAELEAYKISLLPKPGNTEIQGQQVS